LIPRDFAICADVSIHLCWPEQAFAKLNRKEHVESGRKAVKSNAHRNRLLSLCNNMEKSGNGTLKIFVRADFPPMFIHRWSRKNNDHATG
jgi:hypothetical protein